MNKDIEITITGRWDGYSWLQQVSVDTEAPDHLLNKGLRAEVLKWLSRVEERKLRVEEEAKKKAEKAMAQERREKLEKMANDPSFGEHHILASALVDILKQGERYCPKCGYELHPKVFDPHQYCARCGWKRD